MNTHTFMIVMIIALVLMYLSLEFSSADSNLANNTLFGLPIWVPLLALVGYFILVQTSDERTTSRK